MKAPRVVREIARRALRRHGFSAGAGSRVGANVGQYVDHLRGEGYTGRIVSFEPFRLVPRAERPRRAWSRLGGSETCGWGRMCLKVDVQGFEAPVIRGAAHLFRFA